jgi:hypothetical protein
MFDEMAEGNPGARGKRAGGDAVPDHLNKLTIHKWCRPTYYILPAVEGRCVVWKCMLSHRYGQQW